MSAPMRTYGRAREASPDVSTQSGPVMSSNSPLLSPNSRVKKLLADLGDSSDEDEDVEQLRNKFLSKKDEKAQAEAESSPLLNRSRLLNEKKLSSKSIFDSVTDKDKDTSQQDDNTQDDADGLAFSKPIVDKPREKKIGSPDVDSMADTQPDFDMDTQPDEVDEVENGDSGDVVTGAVEKDAGKSLLASPSPVVSAAMSPLLSPSPIASPVATTTTTITSAPTTQTTTSTKQRPRRNRVIADSDSEDELSSSSPVASAGPTNTRGLKKVLPDLSDLSGNEDVSEEEEEESEDESQQRVNALKERLASTVDELDPCEDADVSVISSQKPTRKASKKALEEIERENQRINRQRNLAPEVYTTGLATKQNLLARFGMALKESAEVSVPVTAPVTAAPTTPGKHQPTAPHSDDSIMDFDLNSSPLTSNDPGLHPQEVKEAPTTPSKMMMPPATPSLSRSVNKKQVKKLANVGVHRMASYITKRPSQLLSTLSDSDDDLVIVPDAEADKVPESFRKMQQQGVPVAFSQKPAAGPDFFSQMKANIRKQHAKMKADSERERQQLGLVDLTEQDKEDEAVESLLDQARRQQQEIADREKREQKRARDEEYDSVAESDHDWFDNDGEEEGAEVPDSEDEGDMDVDLSDEDGLRAQQALVDAVSEDEEEAKKKDEEEEPDTQPDFPELDDDAPAVKAASPVPDTVDDIISGITADSPSPLSSPARDNSAYLRQLAADEAAHKRRERARLANSGLLDGEAEESDDDWAGLGGASDEEATRPEDLAEIGRMVDDTKAGADRENYAANRQYDLQKDLDDDAKQVEKLLDDVTNGGLRRKRANNLDLDFSDSEDEDEMRRKRRILSERKKKRMLEAGNLEDLAKNPEAAAFIRAMQDTDSEEEDGEDDVFALPTKPSAAAASLKRQGPALTKKKPSIQETLSFLCEESVVEMPPSSPQGNSDMESDDDLIITGQTHSTIDLTASRQDTVADEHDDEDYLERLGPSRTVVVRETEDDEELKTIIGPNGNFHGLIRKKKQNSMSTTSSTESVSKKKSAKYLQQQESETQKQQSLKNRFLAKFKSVGTKPKSQNYMKGGSFY